MKPTHCIMYIPVNRMDKEETCGGCLDHPLPDGGYMVCLDVISRERCYHALKTPVLKG